MSGGCRELLFVGALLMIVGCVSWAAADFLFHNSYVTALVFAFSVTSAWIFEMVWVSDHGWFE